jgi:maleylpyruvate isomerase
MSDPVALLPTLRASTSALIHGIEADGWSDAEVRAPSLLPGWTRGHVLAHIARNADGITRTLTGALRGERLARYPGGREGCTADIEAGAGRPLAEQLADVRESADRLDRAFAAVADADGWALPTEDRPAGEYVVARWTEVEVHRVDLGGGYGADQWPAAFVGRLLPELAAGAGQRTASSLRIVVTAAGSITDLAGREWVTAAPAGGSGADRSVQAGAPLDVSGPDWALVAWLLGRPGAAKVALSALPDLSSWR